MAGREERAAQWVSALPRRLIPSGAEPDRWSPSLRPADARCPAVAGAIGDASGSSPMAIMERKAKAADAAAGA